MIIPKPNSEDGFRGKRYICSVRQSNDSEGTTSTEAQLEWMHRECEKLGMILVEDMVLAGVTGSIPGKRVDIEKLFQRKRDKDDFDVLVIQRIDRATRSGVRHGMWFEHECARHGIEMLYLGEDLPHDEHHAVWAKVAKYESAYEQAKSISQRSTQGWVYALNQNRCIPVGHTPFGCDRLYLTADGEPLFRIRNLVDGRQQKLDVDGTTVIETYEPDGRFRKQKLQLPLIVPGESTAADTVRRMFGLHYGQGWGGKRITDELNRMGILSPRGLTWSQRQVESIYENYVYCGVAVGGQTSQGIFNRRGERGPEPVSVSSIELASRASAPRTLRPPEEWYRVEQPPMADFLPPAIRDKALAAIHQLDVERWERSQDPGRPTRSTNKHKDSEYILTGLLVARQDGETLSGILCGKVGKKVRKYRHRKSSRGYIKGSIFNNYIRAAELESAVLELVFEVVADVPQLRQRIMDVMARRESATDSQQKLERLKKNRKELAAQVCRILANMTEEDEQDMQPELDRLRRRRRDLDAQIEKISGELRYASDDPKALADGVIARLQNLPKDAGGLDAATKRDLLQAFVEKVEVDMATKDAEVFLKLPSWALEAASKAAGKGRLAHNSPSPTVDETHPLLSAGLAFADCRYIHDRSNRRVCYRCRRKAA